MRLKTLFTWDLLKEQLNILKHKVDFQTASKAFIDPDRKIYKDHLHSKNEKRFFCIGKVGSRVLTVRFTYRAGEIRIIGAGYWRKGARYYEKKENR